MLESIFDIEKQKLSDTVSEIDNNLNYLRRGPATAAYQEAANEIQRIKDIQIEQLVKSRPEPYGFRYDYYREDEGQIARYFGLNPIVNESSGESLVISWTSPFAEGYFSKGRKTLIAYLDVEVEITSLLKRVFDIKESDLKSVTDTYQAQLVANDTPSVDDNDITDNTKQFLVDRLSEVRIGRPQVAIDTLQYDQFQQIAYSPEEVLLIEGVAGSGKSVIASHRLAYLTSQFTGKTPIDLRQTIFFGPTKGFIGQIHGLFNDLILDDIRQEPIREWMKDKLSSQIFIRETQELLEHLLRQSGDQWDDEEMASRVKGSIKMVRTLARYTEKLRKGFASQGKDLVINVDRSTQIKIGQREVKRVLRSNRRDVINEERKEIVERLTHIVWLEFYQKHFRSYTSSRWDSETVEGVERNFKEEFRSHVADQVSAFWPDLDYRSVYRDLLSDSSMLQTCSRKKISGAESRSLAASLTARPRVFKPQDLGPLCYLDTLINNRPKEQFQHVVIDEAQELSACELEFVRYHTSNSSFTILGDLTQSLFPEGVEGWGTISQMLKTTASVNRVPAIRISYRSTDEIVRLANRILRSADKNAKTAYVVGRPGDEPSFNRASSRSEMIKNILNDITNMSERYKTIGVLCKTSQEAVSIQRGLISEGRMNIDRMEKEDTEIGDIVVAPIHLTRGLEFDAVILPSVSEAMYPDTSLHARLLYIGATRAAHVLSLHWHGKLSPPLSQGRRSN